MFDKIMVHQIREKLLGSRQTISIAESVTTGYLQAAIGSAKDASEFFQGGITAYNIGQKCLHLHVEPIQALRCNCVSQQTAEEMAAQVCSMFQSDWGIAITGYATPARELGVHQLFAFYAISFRGTIKQSKKIVPPQDNPEAIQLFYVNYLLRAFAESE